MAPNIKYTSQKWHLIKTRSPKNGILKLTLLVFWSATNTKLTERTPTIRHKLENYDFKISWLWVWIIQQT